MKLFLIAAILTFQCLCNCYAGVGVFPEIPVPKLTPIEALTIADRLNGNRTNFIVVSIEWCKASEFQSRLAQGTCNPGSDAPDEYSWFVTFVYKDVEADKLLKRIHVTRQFNSVQIERIKDNGKQGVLIIAGG